MTFKIAVIGCGWIAQDRHGPSYAKYASFHPDVELAACCDTDAARAEQFRARYAFQRAYTNYLDMLEAEKPSAVCLNVPEQFTCEIGCQVLWRGYPLLTEKPPGLTAAELDRLSEAARASGALHQVAFNRRHTPLLVELKRRLGAASLHHIDHSFYRVGRTNGDFTTTAIHAIDTVRFLAGCDYQQVDIHYQEFPAYTAPGGETLGVANYLLTCAFTSGATAAINLCPVTGLAVERTVVHTPDKTFILKMNLGPDAPGSLQQFEGGQLTWEADGAQFTGSRSDVVLSGFEAEDLAFFEAVRAGRQPADNFASCQQSVAIMQHLHERRFQYRRP